jgi:cytoskeletal protein RodZ
MIGRMFRAPAVEEEKPKGFDDYELRLGDLMRGERATLGKSLLDVQRELKIKASYISAVENADVSAFETPGFVAGYVRSYARYLGMDPDQAFARFCREAKFEVAHGMSAAASGPVAKPARPAESRDPFVGATFIPRSESWLSRVEPGAIGSVAVLLVLIGALGYGGWSVLQEVQRVQLAPVNEAPAVVAEIDPLGNVKPASDLPARAEALDVPVMVPRDGPIASITPEVAPATQPVQEAVAEAAAEEVQVVAEADPVVEVLAVRPSWVRISGADGTILFEKILDAGERYTVPALAQAPLLRAGNSGSIYFTVNGKTYGPASPGNQVVKNLALDMASVETKFQPADPSRDSDLAEYVAEATQAKPAN